MLVDLARNSADSSFGVSFSVEDMDGFENVIPDNVTESGEWKMVSIRELPDMMSASEGEGGHGKADIVREVA